MKHLFLVHSPITYLTSVSVINKLGLTQANAVIIFFEFEKINSLDKSYKSISINEIFPKNNFYQKINNYFRYFNIITRIDKVVNKIAENEIYTAYVPALIWAGKALITNPKCVLFNFIEEGLAHYFDEETIKSLTPVNSKDSWRTGVIKNTKGFIKQLYELLRGYNFRLQALPYSYSCYHALKHVVCYGFSSNSFPLIDKDKRVVLAFNRQAFLNIDQGISHDLSDAIIWIGDGGVTQHGFNKNIYLNAIEKACIPFIKQNIFKQVFIKFHRDEKPALREQVKNLFTKNNIYFQIISDTVIMELLLFKARNATLIGVYSTLLYYAAIMKHNSYSIYSFLKQEYSKVLSDRDLTFFWNHVQLLEAKN